MPAPLRIALVHPHALPARDDVSRHVAAEAAALAARGHRVTVLSPAGDREAVARGRELLTAAAAGDPDALSAAPGEVLDVALGRGLPAGPGRRVGEPFDLAGALETALTRAPFDVVHLHEPLAPSPALAALRHAPGVTAVTFHRAEPLVGVAFLRPLVDRALARAGIRIATTATGREALSQMLPGEYRVIAPGVEAPPAGAVAGGTGLVIVARGRDRVAARFALSMLRGIDLDAVGPVTLIGAAEAPWRTRAAVPKALRGRVEVVPDPGPAGRMRLLVDAGIAVVAGPDEAAGPALREALAAGCAVLGPRSPAADDAIEHGVDGLVLPPFAREAWRAAIDELVADPPRRRALAEAARAAPRRGWDDAAAELEAAYRDALAARADQDAAPRVAADLRVRTGPGLTPERLIAACRSRGIAVVGIAGPGGVADARAVAALAPPGLTVVAGQEITTSEGVLVGLFLTRDVPPGMSPEATATAIREQGGVVLVPHPDAAAAPPPPEALRRIAADIDLHEVLTGHGEAPADAGLMQRMGLRVVAASGADRPEDVGAAVTEVRPFRGPADLLDALSDARLVRAERRRRSREPRTRRRRNRSHES